MLIAQPLRSANWHSFATPQPNAIAVERLSVAAERDQTTPSRRHAPFPEGSVPVDAGLSIGGVVIDELLDFVLDDDVGMNFRGGGDRSVVRLPVLVHRR